MSGEGEQVEPEDGHVFLIERPASSLPAPAALSQTCRSLCGRDTFLQGRKRARPSSFIHPLTLSLQSKSNCGQNGGEGIEPANHQTIQMGSPIESCVIYAQISIGFITDLPALFYEGPWKSIL